MAIAFISVLPKFLASIYRRYILGLPSEKSFELLMMLT